MNIASTLQMIFAPGKIKCARFLCEDNAT